MPTPRDRLAARLAAARIGVRAHDLEALLVSSSIHLRYLFDVVATAGLAVIGSHGATLIVDERYAAQFEAAVRDWPDVAVRRVPVGESYESTVGQVARELAVAALGVEADHLTLGRLGTLRRVPACTGLEWHETTGLVERLRAVKDGWEVGLLREAGARLAEVAACILPKVQAGCTERQIAWEVALALHATGFDGPAFETIVASGPNGARPHHRATDRRIDDGELVVVDFGGVLDGYAVDMTRTVAVGNVPAAGRGWVAAVGRAQRAAIAASAPGMLPSAVDQVARASLEAAGLARYFVHGTGHGLGLEVHERPTIGPRGDHDGPIAAGMVFTVEPGVYVPGVGGVRIEDDVVVTATGTEQLTSAPARFEAHES